MVNKTLTCFVVIFMCIFAVSDGLYCYSCAGSIPSAPCANDTSGLVEARFQNESQYSKNCDLEINQTMCIIETSEGDGKLKTIIRGCSDGFTFSFTEVKLFRHLRATNQTECAVYMGAVICITLCRDNYCNGPQDTSSIAARAQLDFMWLVLFQCIIQIYWTSGTLFTKRS